LAAVLKSAYSHPPAGAPDRSATRTASLAPLHPRPHTRAWSGRKTQAVSRKPGLKIILAVLPGKGMRETLEI